MTITKITIPGVGTISCESDDATAGSSYTDYSTLQSLITSIDKIDPYISADYHFLREKIKTGTSDHDRKRMDEIVSSHNRVVKPTDVFLFLGDIGESEFSDDESAQAELKKIMLKLNGVKILVRGNNDNLSDEFYKACGFSHICDIIQTEKYIFSHKPVCVTGDVLNVHGHLHGNKRYWDIDSKNHIDVYWETNGRKPNRLSDYIRFFKEGKYAGCTTILSEEYRLSDHV